MGHVADANVLIAAINESDTLFLRAKEIIIAAAKPILIPEYVAVECVTVIARNINKSTADLFLNRTFVGNDDFTLLPSSPQLFAVAAKEFLTAHKRLSFVDCALVVLSREYTVLTFDKALAKALVKPIHAA